MSSLLLILLALGFVALVMTIVFSIMLWVMYRGAASHGLELRLQAIAANNPQESQFQVERAYSKNPWLSDQISRFDFLVKTDKMLVTAGFGNLMLDRFVMIVLGASVLTFLSVVSFGLSGLVALLFALLVIVLPFFYLRGRVRSRATQFESQLPDVLEFIARAMQAGHAFGPAIQMAASESPEPIASEFARAQSEINFGVPTTKALADLAERIGSADMRFFAVAVAINREVGGDLAGLLEGISSLIRERVDMRTSVITMTSEGRLSAIILGVLPFLVAGLFFIISPDMMMTLWTNPTGRNMLFGGLGLMAVGALWMRSMIRIKI